MKCADGLYRLGNDCVPYDPNDTSTPMTTADPPGGRTRAATPSYVTLTSSKPALIYYTTDGSDPDPSTATGQPSPAIATGIVQHTTLKFFAIDAAGHREATEITTYEQDITPPGPIQNLAVSVTNSTATVTWTNPSDAHFAGAVVARVADLVDAEPTPGQSYTAPTALTQSVQILYAGSGTQLTDPGLPSGSVRYAAWSFDDLFNYSAPTTATADVGLLGTSATYSFNTGTSVLTLVAPPTDLSLAGTTASFAGTTVTLALSVKNLTNKYFQLPKALVIGVTGATAFGNPDGTAGGFPFRSLGPAFLAPGATVTTTTPLQFTGAAANSTVTINLALGHDPAWLASAQRPGPGTGTPHAFVDSASGIAFTNATADSIGTRGRLGGTVRPGAVIGGRLLDVPTTHATIERWDLTTFKHVASAFLAEGDRANVMQVLAVGGRELAVLKVGGRRSGGGLQVVRLDEGLHINARLDLASATLGKGHTLSAISPDGVVLAIPVDGGIALVDTIQMTQIDADPTTPAVDIVAVPLVSRVRAATFFNGSDGIATAAFASGDVAIITRTASGGYAMSAMANVGTTKGSAITTAPDGRVWIASDTVVSIFDPSSGAVTASAYGNGGKALAVMDGQLWILRADNASVDLVSPTGAIQRTVRLGAAAFGHWIQGTDPR